MYPCHTAIANFGIMKCLHVEICFMRDLTLFYLGGGAKMPYPSAFLKSLQNYSLNWLEIFRVWFSDCLKVVLKIGVRKALNRALSWTTFNRKKSPKKIFFNNFSLLVISMLCLLVKTIKYSLLLFTEIASIMYIKKF